MKTPTEHRRSLYFIVEDIIDRPLTLNEHDRIRECVRTYVEDVARPVSLVKRLFCMHTDRKLEGLICAEATYCIVKCRKCDRIKTVRNFLKDFPL